MFLQPKKTKYKKYKKGYLSKIEYRSNTLKFGMFGLQALESGCISARQIEAARQAITRKTKRLGKVWIRIFPDIPVTKKPIEVRMGKGKGNVDHWVAKVKRGSILFELDGIPKKLVNVALKTGAGKLPVKTSLIES